MDAQNRLEDLLFITRHLADLLEQENIALQRNKLDVVKSLLERKTSLSRAYETRVLGMDADEKGIEDIDPDDIQALRDTGRRVEALIEENAYLLKISLQVSRQFMDSVADAVQNAKPGTGAYGANGQVGGGAKAPPADNPALTLDETL
ncbi:hypothetical protein [Varunaivibrio sulfuroxidans]|uniref:FlgN protein n=1 Tax=Varunaivibrio sulfuroxidans TaxID=1773489 RepID=A0A4R3JBJ4_9PROT|nr:hypothetical protein [Varunaivibrio sulfuroxidans]TCS63004.1 hypothetical protein EDD55_10495 [Varunaivibrio sulfuroxidans]WES31918.1 hypothetical protein P3M64_06065 [Varunaivibrio sulfuroxidans]